MQIPATLSEKLQSLSKPSIDLTTPYHFYYFGKKLQCMHEKLEAYFNTHCAPKTAHITKKILYAIPLHLLTQCFSISKLGAIVVSGGIYLVDSEEKVISKNAKVDLLHSLAIACFAQLCNLSMEISKEKWSNLSFQIVWIGSTLLLANILEKAALIPIVEEVNEGFAHLDTKDSDETETHPAFQSESIAPVITKSHEAPNLLKRIFNLRKCCCC